MTRYVAGFMFQGDKVALVRKNRPKWQAGRLNGIGGHVEEGETKWGAMTREFYEETGYQTTLSIWTLFAILGGSDWEVCFFYAWGDLSKVETKTDEEIVVVDCKDVDIYNSIPNLTWLIPMAKAAGTGLQTTTTIYDIKEI